LVRSGGLHFLAGGCRFVPDLEDIADFGAMSHTEGESTSDSNEEIKHSSQIIEAALKTLTSSFSGGVNYFHLLVSAFQTACRDPR